MTQSVPILLTAEDLSRLRDLVAQNVTTRDADAAEQLEAEIERARIVPAGQVPEGLVTMGSRVEFEDQRTGKRRTIQLVFPSEADAAAGRVSVLAPVGAALLGLSVGQSIEWPLPGGATARLRIVAVARLETEQHVAG
jgi:regulator of nucleoside diphosphate kinase